MAPVFMPRIPCCVTGRSATCVGQRPKRETSGGDSECHRSLQTVKEETCSYRGEWVLYPLTWTSVERATPKPAWVPGVLGIAPVRRRAAVPEGN